MSINDFIMTILELKDENFIVTDASKDGDTKFVRFEKLLAKYNCPECGSIMRSKETRTRL